MTVRGWLIIGGAEASQGLPPEAAVAHLLIGGPPDAGDFKPGQWMTWTPAPGVPRLTLVCVEIPL